ncbi:MAG: hypothetical protein JW993_09030 [Sedimentisphaerales bacterium]|nr:hypothetical protein [Sedimentisphaerales bacterium]
MEGDRERNLGVQPLARLMAEHNLKPHDLVCLSTRQLTHKMVSRACKGRRLTPRTQAKILEVFNAVTQEHHELGDLFSY